MAQGWASRSQYITIAHSTLQSLPDPPLELIDRWQGYLSKSLCEDHADIEKDESCFERHWQMNSEWMVLLNDSPEQEHMIQYWESLVQEKGLPP
ncbi:hypothetical protein K438DRAFT_1984085 [Mycena galopus ATCC 62051]|nr:hypothetical protein K438DRAFT_1984085 [Mycena galopus ATCC 62051]